MSVPPAGPWSRTDPFIDIRKGDAIIDTAPAAGQAADPHLDDPALEGRSNATIDARRIVIFYAAVAAVWIGLSDIAIEWLIGDPAQLALAGTLKGWAFVGITAVLLYGLLAGLVARQQRAFASERASLQARDRTASMLRALVDSSPDGIFAKDREGRYLLFSRGATRITGVDEATVLGRDDSAAFPPEQVPMIRAYDARVMELDCVQTFEERVATVDGPRVYLATKGPLHDAAGRVVGMFGVSRDITEREQSADVLRENEREFRLLAEQTPAIVYRASLDAQSATLYISPRLADLGYSPADWKTDPDAWSKAVHPDDRDRVLAESAAGLDASLATGCDIQVEYRLRDAEGRWRHFHDTARVVQDDEGRPLYLQGVMLDISSRVEAEAALRETEARARRSERHYRLLFDANPHPMWVFERDTLRFLAVNDATVRAYGWSREEFLALTLPALYATYEQDRLQDRLAEWAPAGVANGVWTQHGKDGREMEVEISSAPIDFDGREAKLVLAHDVSHRNEVERQRHAALAEAAAAGRRLQEVLERLGEGFIALDRDWCVTYVNVQAAQLLGREAPQDLVGRHLWTAFPLITSKPFQRAVEQAMASQQAVVLHDHFEASDRWYENRIYPSPDGLSVFYSDISQRRLAEQALRMSEQRYKLAAASGQVWDWDAASNRLNLPAQFWSLLGRDPPPGQGSLALIGQTMHPDDLPVWRRTLREHLAGRVPYALEFRVRHSSGEWHWFQTVGQAVWDASGRASYMAGTIIDINERKQAENALRESEEYRCALFEHLADGVFVYTLDQFVEANAQGLAMLGYTRDELAGLSPLQALAVHDRPRMMAALAEPPSGIAHRAEWDLVRKDGSRLTAEVTTSRLDAKRLVAIARDIGPRRAQELRLRQLSQAVEQSSESMVITNLAAEIEYANATALANTGYSAEEIVGRNARVLQSGKTPRETYEAMWASLSAGQAWKGIFHNRRKDGREYTEFAVISPIRGPDGQVVNYVAVKEDVTEKTRMGEELDLHRHHLEELVERRTAELALATRAAESANAAKSEFLAAMSHEIRTPMNGVVGIVDVLRQSSLSPYQTDLADTIRESAFALLRIIDDILDFSKIEAARLSLECEPLALLPLIEATCDSLQPVAASRGVRLQVFVDPQLPDWITSDAVRLRQILNNLLGNAIKFSGGLERAGLARVRVEPGAAGQLRLQVADNGIGMTAEVLARIFRPFEQGEGSTTRRYGGTGLGLAICHSLAKLFGGTIEVASVAGEGSTFTVTLPLQADTGPADSAPAHDLAGLDCHVLLDDADQARDWCAYLAAAGARAMAWPDQPALLRALAANPLAQAVALVETEADDSPPLEVAAGEAGQAQPIVFVRHGQRQRPRRTGPGRVTLDADAMHRDTLLESVALATDRAEPESPEWADGLAIGTVVAPGVEEAAAQGRLILVAEDNDINREVIRRQLALLGLAAEIAEDGLQALTRWRLGRQQRRYALLLTDLHMPGLDGYELTARIRAEEPSDQRLPIVALTANALRGEAGRCREAGMDAYLSKPVQLAALSSTLTRWLPAASVTTVEPEAMMDAASEAPATLPVFDPTVLPRLIGDDAALLAQFHGDFLVSLRKSADELRTAAGRSAWDLAGAVAHRLKSSSRAVGALALGDCCQQLEHAGKAGDAAAGGSALLRFEAALEEVVVSLEGGQTASGEPASAAAAVTGVLLLDDEPFQLEMLQHQLGLLGVAQVQACRSGASALQWLQGRDTSSLLLLLDLNMPDMDGVEFMRHLAERHYAGTLALVSGADSRVLEAASKLAAAYQLNVLGHLHKPVSSARLRSLIERWHAFAPKPAHRTDKVYSAQDLERAIGAGELLLHYQPKVALADGALVGVEALVRWQHPADGLVFPDRFIAVAEQHGLIDGLTRNVLTQALAQVRRWRDGGMALRMAVNVSMNNLTRVDFSEFVFEELARQRVSPTELVLEVTESQLLHDMSAPMDILTRLRLKQVGLSIDDFGTGHSSLAQLRDIPFDELKIDRGFVHGNRKLATQRAIYTASLAMAHELGMTVVAEGVEDRADWDFVRETGCDVAQGYFIARPMPPGDLPGWAAQWKPRFEALG